MCETWVRSLGWEDPLEEETATHSSTLAWRIPWTEEPVGCSPQGCKESDTTERLHLTFMAATDITLLPEHTQGICGTQLRTEPKGEPQHRGRRGAAYAARQRAARRTRASAKQQKVPTEPGKKLRLLSNPWGK